MILTQDSRSDAERARRPDDRAGAVPDLPSREGVDSEEQSVQIPGGRKNEEPGPESRVGGNQGEEQRGEPPAASPWPGIPARSVPVPHCAPIPCRVPANAAGGCTVGAGSKC